MLGSLFLFEVGNSSRTKPNIKKQMEISRGDAAGLHRAALGCTGKERGSFYLDMTPVTGLMNWSLADLFRS